MSEAMQRTKANGPTSARDVPEMETARPTTPRQSHVAPRHDARLRIEAFGNTDVGLVREGNEDSFAVLHQLGLYMVADGMGGAAAGEVASKIAIECVREAFEDPDVTWPAVAGERAQGMDASVLVAGIHRANVRIRNLAGRDSSKKGMGTTFAGLLALDDRLVIAHVGDSRVYRLRNRRLDLLTEDHSLLNACIQAGVWDPDSTEPFPRRNAITRAVGLEDDLEVDTRIDAPWPGDIYLICSDGLHGMLNDSQIADVLLREHDLTLAVGRLIEEANDLGGHDNITAVLVGVTARLAR